VTEQEWLQSDDLESMLGCLGKVECSRLRLKRIRRRLFRLFACACCAGLSNLIPSRWAPAGVNVAERIADGDSCAEERKAIMRDLAMVSWKGISEQERDARAAIGFLLEHERHFDHTIAYSSAEGAAQFISHARSSTFSAESKHQVRFIHDIFGNPFRPLPKIDPPWLAWNGRTIPTIAQAIYDDRAFDRMPVLADALEEGSCDDDEILNHCRQPGVHVKGCWVLDLLLGKA